MNKDKIKEEWEDKFDIFWNCMSAIHNEKTQIKEFISEALQEQREEIIEKITTKYETPFGIGKIELEDIINLINNLKS